MVIKVYSKNNGQQVKPAVKFASETDSEVAERKAVFKLESNKAYMLAIEYSGDFYDRMNEEEACLYFDMTIAINSLKSLAKKLSCSAHDSIRSATSILSDLPKEIQDKDLAFTLHGLYVLKYPQDFTELKFQKNGQSSHQLMLPTMLSLKDPFVITSEIGFDVNVADFSMQVLLYDEDMKQGGEDDDSELVGVMAASSPLMNLQDNDDETFLRAIRKARINPREEHAAGLRYLLAIEERQAFYIFNEVTKAEGVSDLCLPFIFKLEVLKEDDKSAAALSLGRQLRRHAMSHSLDKFDAAHVVDFKIISHDTDRSRAQKL